MTTELAIIASPPPVLTLSEAERLRHAYLKDAIKQGLRVIGTALAEIKRKGLWREDAATWQAYIAQEYKHTANWAWRQIEAVEFLAALPESVVKHEKEGYARVLMNALKAFPDEYQPTIRDLAIAKAVREGVTLSVTHINGAGSELGRNLLGRNDTDLTEGIANSVYELREHQRERIAQRTGWDMHGSAEGGVNDLIAYAGTLPTGVRVRAVFYVERTDIAANAGSKVAA
jgi:hypothetical protein